MHESWYSNSSYCRWWSHLPWLTVCPQCSRIHLCGVRWRCLLVWCFAVEWEWNKWPCIQLYIGKFLVLRLSDGPAKALIASGGQWRTMENNWMKPLLKSEQHSPNSIIMRCIMTILCMLKYQQFHDWWEMPSYSGNILGL